MDLAEGLAGQDDVEPGLDIRPVDRPSAAGQLFGALHADEQHSVGEAVGHLRAGEIAPQLGVGDVGDKADMGIGRTVRVVLDQGAQVAVVPSVPEHGRQGVALAVHALECLGQLALDQQQPLVGHAFVDDFRLVLFRFAVLHPLLDRVADAADQPFAG